MEHLLEDVYKRQVLTLKSLEAFARAADGKATKIIIPSDIQGIAGLASSLKEIVTDPDVYKRQRFRRWRKKRWQKTR